MDPRRGIVWFRNDLRLHDNEALHEALTNCDEVLCVYVFDDRFFKAKTSFGFPKTGKYRAQFIIESVAALRQKLEELGGKLIVRSGHADAILADLAQTVKSSWIFCNRERTQEEVDIQDTLEKNLWAIGQEMRYTRGKMLYHTADLPFPVNQTPDVFTHFRKEVERFVKVRPPLPAPTEVKSMPVRMEDGELPTLSTFGLSEIAPDPRATLNFKGGEATGLERLHYYFEGSKLASTYKETRNELIGGDYSTKFSPWLAQGCLSPKQIIAELYAYESKFGANKSTYWIFFELLWRDFFRLLAKKYDTKIFQKGGTKGEVNPKWKNDRAALEKWINGNTGVPFVDANMHEIAATGFMSNRGRQNVASYLVKDLHVNWQMGAEYFESVLIDYDPASNYGNWNYLAGVGSDPREDRYFNIKKQQERYDPEGKYVDLWQTAHLV